MIRNLLRYGALVGVIGLGACDLNVDNPNQPNTGKVLATPNDAEALLASYYKRWHDGLYRNTGNIRGMLNVQSFENYSSLANDCQNARAGIPRPPNDNSIGNTCDGNQARVYFVEQEVTRVASAILGQLDGGLTLGSTAQDQRARAFGQFLRGVSLGYVALFYDSAAVVIPGQSTEDAGPLRDYKEVMDSALSALQQSLDATTASAAATTAGEAGGFPLPSTWIPSPTSFTSANFTRLVRSYRARLRANVARDPAERAAVDWNAVIADAQAGITADHQNITNSSSGPFATWISQYDVPPGLWHQMPPWIIGMADNSGSYAAWIAQPIDQRGNPNFHMVTPDLRWPQGASRSQQQADFAVSTCQAAATVCKRYFSNRSAGADLLSGLGWGWSEYDFNRWHSWRVSGDGGTGTNGALTFFPKAELNLLEAEGHMRKSPPDYAAAMALINISRTAPLASGVATGGGLPALTVPDNVAPAPGGADCVPKVPVAPTYTVIACGNMLEAMKWEKRMETAYIGFGAWFLDSRGWGDLTEGTPLYFAVPFSDLQARKALTIYSTGVGGVAGSAAPKGTYGW